MYGDRTTQQQRRQTPLHNSVPYGGRWMTDGMKRPMLCYERRLTDCGLIYRRVKTISILQKWTLTSKQTLTEN